MFTVISRIFHYGIKSFRRNALSSTATVVVMIFALLMYLGLIMFNVATEQVLAQVQDKIDISVYFNPDAPEDEILAIKDSLERLDEVKIVDYISREKALEVFRESNKDDATITQAINELKENPLEASLNVKAHQPEQYASIAEYLSSPNLEKFIDTVTYTKNQVVIDRLAAIMNTANRGGILLTIVLSLVAGLVVFNTVRLAIYSNRDEIGIMRVVGASNSLVRGPYMVTGVVAGLVGAIVSFIIVIPLLYFIAPYLRVLSPGLDLFRYFYSNFLMLLLYQVLIGSVIGGLSSFFAVRKYLRN